MRRGAALVLALAYLMQAGWILQGGADLLFPRVQTVKAGESRCCTDGCGCPVEAQKRKACCCYPQPQPPAAETTQVPVSSFEESRCRGVEGAVSVLLSQPAILGAVGWPPAIEISAPIDLSFHPPTLPFFDRSWDKVPIL